jgi:hydrogenase/urease accessory protein HupE
MIRESTIRTGIMLCEQRDMCVLKTSAVFACSALISGMDDGYVLKRSMEHKRV